MPTGIYIRTEKHKKEISERQRGRKLSEETKKKLSEARKGKKHSEETKRKLSEMKRGKSIRHSGSFKKGHDVPQEWRETYRGENNRHWKGDKVKYRSLHSWIERQLGKPRKCEFCEITIAKRYEWANISGEYKRDISDFMRLCVKCHSAYDRGKIII